MPEFLTHFRAAIFDMDGVVTDTASIHARACQLLFDEVLRELAHGAVPAFDPDQKYRRHVAGRAREDGVRACWLEFTKSDRWLDWRSCGVLFVIDTRRQV